MTYIVNNCTLQRDSQASCSLFNVQMGETFSQQLLHASRGAAAGPGVRCELPQRPPSRAGMASLRALRPVRREDRSVGLSSACSTFAAFPVLQGFRGGLCGTFAVTSSLPPAAPCPLQGRLMPTVSVESDRMLRETQGRLGRAHGEGGKGTGLGVRQTWV